VTVQVGALAEWAELIARSFVPMEVRAHGEARGFRASLARSQMGTVGVSLIDNDAHVADRTPRMISLHPADYVKISLQLVGACLLEQDGRHVALGPGDLALYDAGRPFRLTFDRPGRSIVVQFPRHRLGIEVVELSRITACPCTLAPGYADALGGFLSGIAIGAAPRSPLARERLAAGVVELIAAALPAPTPPAAGPDEEPATFASLRDYSLAHLSQPELCIEDLASAHFVSVRTVQRTFTGRGTTYTTWLREQRLARAAHRLDRSTDPVGLIAHECGFTSVAHFSRSFRRRYGLSPQQFRARLRR
jgi:AraC-like DNA-binding protein